MFALPVAATAGAALPGCASVPIAVRLVTAGVTPAVRRGHSYSPHGDQWVTVTGTYHGSDDAEAAGSPAGDVVGAAN